MTEVPLPRNPRVSEFYERKRKLAYFFGWISLFLMFGVLSLGFLLELFRLPRVAVDRDSIAVVHRAHALGEDDPGSRLLLLDAALKPRVGPVSLSDAATAVLPDGDQVTVFYGSRAAVLQGGQTVRSVDLGQKWDVLAALHDPPRSTSWIVGWNEGKIVARRRGADGWDAETEVGPAATIDRLSASMDGESGPFVAWRERNSGIVHTAIFDGAQFVADADFDIGEVEHWDAVRSGGRSLLATYHRSDRTFQYVTLRLDCCPKCPSPAASRKLAFADPFLLLGRKVTGLSMVAQGGRLRFFVTRWTTMQTASVPLSTLQAESGGAKMTGVDIEPVWRLALAALAPFLMIFFSLAMIFLGFTLLQERGRVASGDAASVPRAEVLHRVMAFVLDHLLLLPVFFIAIELLNVSPDTSTPDLEDPRFLQTAAVWLGLQFLYYFAMEWRLGWTFGKWIIGLRVTELDGSRLGFRGALVRNVVRLLDAEWLTLGVLLGLGVMFSTTRRQRLGDLLAKTVVVQELSTPESGG